MNLKNECTFGVCVYGKRENKKKIEEKRKRKAAEG